MICTYVCACFANVWSSGTGFTAVLRRSDIISTRSTLPCPRPLSPFVLLVALLAVREGTADVLTLEPALGAVLTTVL